VGAAAAASAPIDRAPRSEPTRVFDWLVEHRARLLALVGALALDDELAAAVPWLMFTGGTAVEDVASGRARRELTALLRRAPRTATLVRDGDLQEVPVHDVHAGDAVLGAAAAGYLPPVAGALLREVIDLAVILNALRALGG
jgi:cation transport ATPase